MLRFEVYFGLVGVNFEIYFLKFVPIIHDGIVQLFPLQTGVQHFTDVVVVWFLIELQRTHIVNQINYLNWQLVAQHLRGNPFLNLSNVQLSLMTFGLDKQTVTSVVLAQGNFPSLRQVRTQRKDSMSSLRLAWILLWELMLPNMGLQVQEAFYLYRMCCPLILFLQRLHLPKSTMNKKGDSLPNPTKKLSGFTSLYTQPKLCKIYNLSSICSPNIRVVFIEKVPPQSLSSCSRLGPSKVITAQ